MVYLRSHWTNKKLLLINLLVLYTVHHIRQYSINGSCVKKNFIFIMICQLYNSEKLQEAPKTKIANK